MKIHEKELDINYDRSLAEFITQNLVDTVARYRPDGFGVTASEYAREIDTAGDVARRALKKMVKRGLLKCDRMITPGQSGSSAEVYYRPEDEHIIRNVSDGDE